METEDLHESIEDLTTNIDELETAVAPLLSGPLSHQTSKLPLLDQAKLYCLAVYSIESLLFSALRLNGVDARTHPVFQELNRVKEYFSKIKVAETGGANAKRNVTLDKEAAGRFIKAGLAGNERYDRGRAERQEAQRAGAKRKLDELGTGRHMRFEEDGERVKVVKADGVESDGEEGSSAAEPGVGHGEQSTRKRSKKKKGHKVERFAKLMASVPTEQSTQDDETHPSDGRNEEDSADGASTEATAGKNEKRSGKPKKPKTSKEALENLLEGTLEGEKDSKRRKRKKSERLEDERAEEMK